MFPRERGNLFKEFVGATLVAWLRPSRAYSRAVISMAVIQRPDLFFHQLTTRKINKLEGKINNRAALDYYRIAQ